MTEIQKIEQAIRRVVDHLRVQPWETGVEAALLMVADELARTAAGSGPVEPVGRSSVSATGTNSSAEQ